VFVPAGTYLLKSGLRVSLPKAGVHLVGEGPASLLYFQREAPNGPFDEAIRLENAAGSAVRDLRLFCDRNRGFTHGVHVTCRPVGGGPGSTQAVSFERVACAGFPVAFAVGADTGQDVSEIGFHDCVGEATEAAFLLGNGSSANVLNVRMFGCGARESRYGVKVMGCPFAWYGGTAQHNSEADFYVWTPNTAPIVIDGVRSEHSRRFFFWASGNTYAMPVSIRGCHVSAWTAPDGIVVLQGSNSPLSVSDCVFNAGSPPARFQVAYPTSPPGWTTFSNVGVNNPTPIVNADPKWLRLTNLGLYRVDNATGAPMGACDYPASAATAPRRAQGQATIPHGKTQVVVEHGLGAQPAPEDVAVVRWPPPGVWLAGMDDKVLMFRVEQPAPAGRDRVHLVGELEVMPVHTVAPRQLWASLPGRPKPRLREASGLAQLDRYLSRAWYRAGIAVHMHDDCSQAVYVSLLQTLGRERFDSLVSEIGRAGIRDVLGRETAEGPGFFRVIDTVKKRAQRERRLLSLEAACFSIGDGGRVRHEDLREAIGRSLNPREAALILATLAGETPAEIAGRWGVAPKTISNEKTRAMRKLREAIVA
jgi:hypothetical protein